MLVPNQPNEAKFNCILKIVQENVSDINQIRVTFVTDNATESLLQCWKEKWKKTKKQNKTKTMTSSVTS